MSDCKCPTGKCLIGKCLVRKCPVGKCLVGKCPTGICSAGKCLDRMLPNGKQYYCTTSKVGKFKLLLGSQRAQIPKIWLPSCPLMSMAIQKWFKLSLLNLCQQHWFSKHCSVTASWRSRGSRYPRLGCQLPLMSVDVQELVQDVTLTCANHFDFADFAV